MVLRSSNCAKCLHYILYTASSLPAVSDALSSCDREIRRGAARLPRNIFTLFIRLTNSRAYEVITAPLFFLQVSCRITILETVHFGRQNSLPPLFWFRNLPLKQFPQFLCLMQHGDVYRHKFIAN